MAGQAEPRPPVELTYLDVHASGALEDGGVAVGAIIDDAHLSIGQLVPVVISQLGYSQAQRGAAFEQGEHSRVGSPGEPVKDRSGRAFTLDRRTSGGNEITRASPGRAVSTMS